jgi:hypothetical protein
MLNPVLRRIRGWDGKPLRVPDDMVSLLDKVVRDVPIRFALLLLDHVVGPADGRGHPSAIDAIL